MPKRLGIIGDHYAQPVFFGLNEIGFRESHFQVARDTPAQLALKLRQSKLDGAFLSPVDYAKDYSMYRIVPEVAVASTTSSKTIGLFFNEHLRDLKTIAVDPNYTSEIVLANLVLIEKYGITVKVIPFIGSIKDSLRKADAVLLVGNDVVHIDKTPKMIDLVDEWDDVTNLPFVHGFWVTRERALTFEEMQYLIGQAREGEKHLWGSTIPHLPEFFDHLQYNFDEKARSGLTEFFRMAYYHGILKDLPDVKFHSLENSPDHN